jgi:hypothetical protein
MEESPVDMARVFLLCVAAYLFIAQFFIPSVRDVDPGRGSEGILLLIIVFRAPSTYELPTVVLVAGSCLAALVSAMNHGVLKSPSAIWTPTAFVLLGILMFWGEYASLP